MTAQIPLTIRGSAAGITQSAGTKRFAVHVPGEGQDLVLAPPAHGSWRAFYINHPQDGWAVTDDLLRTLREFPELEGAEVSVLRPGGLFAITPDGGPRDLYEAGQLSAPYRELPKDSNVTLQQAGAWLDIALADEVKAIARGGGPIRLLLSGGVDSGLLASHLMQAGADLTCVTMKTPWGDEIEGATRTSKHVGAKLQVLDVSADEIQSALKRCMRLLQTSDAESVAIHVLVTMALEMGGSTSLVTGLGSDLLNATGDVGMENASDNLVERLVSVSGSGLMSTFEQGVGARLFHPYWTPASIAAQLSVPRSMKSRAGVDKYYLRELGSQRLPAETAYGRKVAIHQGSGLVPGLEAYMGMSLQEYCSQAWDQIVAESTNTLEPIA